MKSIYRKVWLLSICFVLSSTAWSQVRNITGKVNANDNTPLPGVNILVKGTTTGTQTDATGTFALEASDTDVLVFSFIGYASQEIRVGGPTTINVMMSDDVTNLEEIVVVGYG